MDSPTKIVIFFAVAIVLIILVFLYMQNKNMQTAKNMAPVMTSTMSADETATRNTFNAVLKSLQANAANNPLTIDTLISALQSNGIQGLKEGTAIDSVYDPKRIIIKETAVNCLIPPCYSQFTILSIG